MGTRLSCGEKFSSFFFSILTTRAMVDGQRVCGSLLLSKQLKPDSAKWLTIPTRAMKDKCPCCNETSEC
eukprot:scaffold296646_cov33-Tisochrysis_lutea.AAC.1